MLESLSGLLTAIKAAGPRLFFGVAVASGILLFAPASVLTSMGLAEAVVTNRSTIGLVFLVSTVLVCSEGLWWLVRKQQQRTESKALEAGRLRNLHALTAIEKTYLADYIFKGENTLHFGLHDGVAGGLETKGIIYRPTHVGTFDAGWAYNLQPWARELLSKHTHLLQGANGRVQSHDPRQR